jgi:type I restriction enzyme M protein
MPTSMHLTKKKTGNEVVIELTEVDDILSMLKSEITVNHFQGTSIERSLLPNTQQPIQAMAVVWADMILHRIATDFNNPDWILSLNEDPFFISEVQIPIPNQID